MAVTSTKTFTDAANYTISQGSIASNLGKLSLHVVAQTATQSCSSSAGFSAFDMSYLDFSGGKMNTVDKRPTGALWAAKYDTSVNASYTTGGVAQTASSSGSPTITSSKLALLGGASSVRYTGAGNFDSYQTGTISFRYTPAYTGSPSATRYLFAIQKTAGDGANNITLSHTSGGQLALQVTDNVGANIINVNLGAWSPSANNEYSFELNYDITGGATRLFINGTQFGSTQTGTGTRSGGASMLSVGSVGGGFPSDGYFRDFMVFNYVKHTADFGNGIPSVTYNYPSVFVSCPSFSLVGVSNLVGTTFSATVSGVIHYRINSKWWNGSAWVASTGTYADTNTASEVNANIGSLDVSSGTVTLGVVFPDSYSTSYVDEVVLGYNADKYYDEATFELIAPFAVQSPTSFSAVVSEPGSTVVRYVVKVGSNYYYHNGSAWVQSSSPAYAESSSATFINNNLATLWTALSLTENQYVRFVAILHSSDLITTPTITSFTFTYDFGGVAPADPGTCWVYGFLRDLSNTAQSGVRLQFSLVHAHTQYVEIGDGLIATLDPMLVTTDANGYFELELIRSSEFENGPLDYMVEVADTNLTFTVPDADSLDLTSLLSQGA